jgi:hypothetical protein
MRTRRLEEVVIVLESVPYGLNGELSMKFLDWLRRFSSSLSDRSFTGQPGNSTHPQRRPRLRLDPLEDRTVPSLVGSPSAITFGDPSNPQVRVYALGDDGALKESAFDGTAWHWTNLGAPTPTLLTGTPSPVASPSGIDVYVLGTDGHLKLDSFRNGSWSWYELGSPNGVALAGDPIATSDPTTGDKFVYIRGSDGALKENHRVAALGFFWSNLGKPAGVALDGDPSVVLFDSFTISVFARGTDRSLKEADWLGVSWNWSDRGKAGGVPLNGNPNAVFDPTIGAFRVYLEGTDGALKEDLGLLGIGWTWSDLGTAGGVTLAGSPSAIAGPSGVSVFALGSDGSLKEDDASSGSWVWTDQGTGNGIPLTGNPSAVVDTAGDLRVYVLGADGSLKEDYSEDAIEWTWSDLGTPGTGGGPRVVGGDNGQRSADQTAPDPDERAFRQSEARLSDPRPLAEPEPLDDAARPFHRLFHSRFRYE